MNGYEWIAGRIPVAIIAPGFVFVRVLDLEILIHRKIKFALTKLFILQATHAPPLEDV